MEAFGEWLPDYPALACPGATVADGVIPSSDGHYSPLGALSTEVSAQIGGNASSRVMGACAVRDADGNVSTFAGRDDALYKRSGTSWSDVKIAGGYNTAVDGYWKFAQFGQRVIATNFDDPVQSYVLGTSSAFANLAAAAPQARHIAVVKDFVMVGNTYDGADGNQPNRVWWCAQNDPTSWPTPGGATAAAAQSDNQNLPNGGWVNAITGAVGGADGAVFMDSSIYRITYAGPPVIFAFQEVERTRGCIAPNGVVNVGAYAFYPAEDGFYVFDGASSQPIGAGKVDKHFFARVDDGNRHLIYGAADIINKVVFWSYPESGSDYANRLIMYNWQTGRWAEASDDYGAASPDSHVLFGDLTPGYTLEALDSVGNLDALPFSLDSRIWTGGAGALSVISNTNRLQRFSAMPVQATVETPEIGGPRRLLASGVAPYVDVADSSNVTVKVRTRNKPGASLTDTSAKSLNTDGFARFHVDARYLRARVTVAAGASWSRAQGVDIDMRPSGAL